MPVIDDHGRPQPPEAAGEAETLQGFLDYQRSTFAWKTAGLDAAGLNTTVAASSMTLGGMMKHLALVEDYWFSQWLHDRDTVPPFDTADWDADPDWEWHSATADTPEQLRTLWQDAVDRSRDRVAEALDEGRIGSARRPQRQRRQLSEPALDPLPHDRGVRAPQRPCRPDSRSGGRRDGGVVRAGARGGRALRRAAVGTPSPSRRLLSPGGVARAARYPPPRTPSPHALLVRAPH